MGTPAGLIQKKQIQLIKIAQKELCIDDGTYREMLFNHFRVKSCTKLSYAQGKRMIELMKAKGFKPKSKNPPTRRPQKVKPGAPRKTGKVVKIASAEQLRKIGALSNLIHWRVKDGLTRWLFARFSIERVKTAQEAYLAIEGLKAMFENQMKKQFGPEWRDLKYDDSQIMEFLELHVLPR